MQPRGRSAARGAAGGPEGRAEVRERADPELLDAPERPAHPLGHLGEREPLQVAEDDHLAVVVAQALEQELRRDRAPSKSVQVSDFGLIIITRKRVKSSLERMLTEPCPYCSGTGAIKASATICYDILTEIKKVRSELDGYSLVLRVNPEIARALKDESRSVFRELETLVGRPVTVRPDEQLHHEQFDLMAI